jgi:hypothetical protein
MDARSEACLAHVHPDLARVMRAAAQAPQGFVVDYGLRTVQAEQAAVASGHSQTMHSRHLPDAHFGNLAMAVDVIATGPDPFAKGREAEVFGQIWAQVLAAARELAAQGAFRKLPSGEPAIQWGGMAVGAWQDGVVSHWRDWGHIQADPTAYA